MLPEDAPVDAGDMEGVLADRKLAQRLVLLVVAQAHTALQVVLVQHALLIVERAERCNDLRIKSLALLQTQTPSLLSHRGPDARIRDRRMGNSVAYR